MEPLLTIAIPTYNRCTFLERSLYYLLGQINDAGGKVEIIISDNCSSDATTEVVNKYIQQGLVISYIKNETNIGVDKNIVQCYERAKGRFVWIMGDDDYLVPGSLPQIIEILTQNPTVGICYIRSKWMLNPDEYTPAPVSKLNWSEDTNNSAFLGKVHYWITFITGNIVNKAVVTDLNINSSKFLDTNLVQLGWTIPALFHAEKNIIIDNELLICQGNNTGGYSLVKVFAHNFNRIMNDFVKQGYNKQLKTIVNTNLLDSFFVYYYNNVTVFKMNSVVFLYEMGKSFWRYPIFWRKYVLNKKWALSLFS
ncbi:glycosyltransferase family 2 protein [Niastella sp. OAS944]|uniref:glycosyltransferase family 2 protein n=1 Tax=Niastella sp. OAS944 TaxID=2664089 RepID=UPI003490DA46|nr:glycosyltransferase involved in cell wall biosynthesis [Chitinophagaceae bacterium OAS944]